MSGSFHHPTPSAQHTWNIHSVPFPTLLTWPEKLNSCHFITILLKSNCAIETLDLSFYLSQLSSWCPHHFLLQGVASYSCQACCRPNLTAEPPPLVSYAMSSSPSRIDRSSEEQQSVKNALKNQMAAVIDAASWSKTASLLIWGMIPRRMRAVGAVSLLVFVYLSRNTS